MRDRRRAPDFDPELADLLLRAKRGDEGARGEFFLRVWRLIALTAQSCLPARSSPLVEREDIIQDVWLSVSQAVDHFEYEGTSSLLCYLRQSALRMAARRRGELEAKKRDVRRNEPLREIVDERDPATSAIAREADERLLRALQQLSFEQAEMFRRVVLEGATRVSAAGELGIPETSARRHLSHAKARLAYLLGHDRRS